MSHRDANIAYLKRLKTRYELRAKELELQEIAARYRLDVFKTVPPPLFHGHPHHRRYHRSVVRVPPRFDGDGCPCDADVGHNKLGSSRDEEIPSTADHTDQLDSKQKETDESSPSLDSLDLATLSSIRQLVLWEHETKRRIARLDKLEKVVVSLMAEKPPLHKNDNEATVEREPIPNFDSEIRLEVDKMKEVVDHLVLKVNEPASAEPDAVTPSSDVPPRCIPECPLGELSSNLQDAAQYVNETMPAINSSLARIERMFSKQETEHGATEGETSFEADVAEPITLGEPDESNSKMETMRRNIHLVVDHLKVCEECPVEEFTSINHDLEDILEIFHSIHNAGDEVTGGTAVSEQDGTAKNIIDEIIARASQIVCENIIKETEASMQQIKQLEGDESPLDGENTEMAESYDKKQQELIAPEPTAAHAKTNCGCLAKHAEPTQRMLLIDQRLENAVENERPEESAPAETSPTAGESVSCQTVITFPGRSKVNVTAICVSSVAPCVTLTKDEDNPKNFCKCENIEKVEAVVSSKVVDGSMHQMPSEEKPIATLEAAETPAEAPAVESALDSALSELAAVASPHRSTEDVPLAAAELPDEVVLEEKAVETPSVRLSVEVTTQEPSAGATPLETFEEPGPIEPLPELAPIEPKPELAPIEPTLEPAPIEPLPEPAPIEPLPKAVPIDPTPEPAPIEPTPEPAPKEPLPEPAPIEPLPEAVPINPSPEPAALEVLVEITDLEPARKPSPAKPMTEGVIDTTPMKPSVEPPTIGASKDGQEPVEQALSNNLPSKTVTEPASVASKVASSKSVVKSPVPQQSPVKVTSSAKPLKLVDPIRSPAKSASTPTAVKPAREKSPIKRIPSPTASKISREKSPVKIASPPIAAKANREKSPVKGVSSPIAANKPQEKIPVKSVASPIAAKSDREKSPVKSTASPTAMKPNAANVPGKSGSTASAARSPNRKPSPEKISPKVSTVRPVGPKASAAKRPSTPSTYKIPRPSIGSVGSRSTARSTGSKRRDSLNLGSKGDAPLERTSGSPQCRCECKKRKESPCSKRDRDNDVAARMCPSSPQRKCLCRRPSSRRESPVKERVNDDASAEGLHIQAPRRCYCSQWKKYRESLSKSRTLKDVKEEDKSQIVKKKKCKCKKKKQK